MRDHREEYADFFPNEVAQNIDEYLCLMSKDGEWGDDLMLQAAVDMLKFTLPAKFTLQLKIVTTRHASTET